MSRQMLLCLGMLLVGLVSGTFLGLSMSGASGSAADSRQGADQISSGSVSGLEANDRVKDNTVLSERIRELEKELADQKKDQSAVAAERFDFFKKHHQEVRQGLPSFNGDLKVSPEMAEILSLTPEEQKAINQRMAELKKKMEKFEQDNTSVVKQTSSSLTVEIPINPQAKALKDNLTGDLASDIGEDRSKVLLDYTDFSAFSALNQLSEIKKTIEIDWSQQQDGHPLYAVKDSYVGADGAMRGTSTSSSTAIPPDYQKYITTDSTP